MCVYPTRAPGSVARAADSAGFNVYVLAVAPLPV